MLIQYFICRKCDNVHISLQSLTQNKPLQNDILHCVTTTLPPLFIFNKSSTCPYLIVNVWNSTCVHFIYLIDTFLDYVVNNTCTDLPKSLQYETTGLPVVVIALLCDCVEFLNLQFCKFHFMSFKFNILWAVASLFMNWKGSQFLNLNFASLCN